MDKRQKNEEAFIAYPFGIDVESSINKNRALIEALLRIIMNMR